MRCGGISLLGSYHAKNQDSFYSGMIGNTGLIAVSDGLGSCSHSEIGSKALVQSARAILLGRQGKIADQQDFTGYIREVYERWQVRLEIEKQQINDCCCTCLLCLIASDEVYIARLGDGMVGLMLDGQPHIFVDKKANGFSNETKCLGSKFNLEDWEIKALAYESFAGALACTDGVNVAPAKRKAFVADLVREYAAQGVTKIQEELQQGLRHWKSNDDKTLAFILPDLLAEGEGVIINEQ